MSDQATGLSSAEAAERLARDGCNELPSPEKRGLLRIVAEVLSEPMFMLLLVAGVLYLLLGDFAEGIALLLFANVSLGIAVIQELRSEKVLEALRELTNPTALVIRDGERRSIPSRELVKDDVILVAEGDRVPADAALIVCDALEADESMLTGESVPVRKRVATPADSPDRSPGGDDLPFLYSGTMLVRGGGRARVIATGVSSQIGKIGKSLGSIQVEPPRLQAQTRRLVRIFGILGLGLSTLVVVLYAMLRGSIVEGLLAGIAVGMSLLPEEFPLVLTVFMVMGARRISHAGVLTRRSAAIESLGAATVLCTDKTGTLTQNRMAVAELRASTQGAEDAAGQWNSVQDPRSMPRDALRVLEVGVLASPRDALDPMDRSLHELLAGVRDDASAWIDAHPVVLGFGLTPELPAMTILSRTGQAGTLFAASKGAPEAIAALCRFSDAQRASLVAEVDRIAATGVRVLAVAEATAPEQPPAQSPRDLAFRFVGLAGFVDPLREQVRAAVDACRGAGVRVVMITGDYPATARAIAGKAGIDAAEVLGGDELRALDDAALAARVRDCSVFARILPDQKLRIVEALKSAGEVVAMIGDGVNDAPSLRAAHIGVAMGRRGTDVAREASSIVLLEDDFRALVQTIRLGRRIYDNLRKAMGYVVALHVPIAGLAVLPLLLGMPLILTPIMIALLELIIDPVCSVVFEAEEEEPDIMRRPPRDPASAILPLPLLAWFALQGLAALVLVAGVFASAVSAGMPEREIRSLVFASLVATNVALIFVNRSFGGTTSQVLARKNRLLWYAIATTALLVAVVLSWSPARDLFRFGPMHVHDVGICLGAGALLFALLQLLKGWWKERLAV